MVKQFTFLKWYTKVLKSGKVKVYAREKGKYKKWEDSTTLDRPNGEYKRINIIINFIPTKGDRHTPTSTVGDNFEVNLELPEYDYNKDYLQKLGEDALLKEGFSDFMVESCDITVKSGKDFIGFSSKKEMNYKIIDLARPQYHYPKNGRGEFDDDNEYEKDEE